MHVILTLIGVYLETVDLAIPILQRSYLLEICQSLRVLGPSAIDRIQGELPVLNLVFAIAQTYQDMSGETRDLPQAYRHETYFTRARLLGALDGAYIFSMADLRQVRLLGLTGMYLLASHQTNR